MQTFNDNVSVDEGFDGLSYNYTSTSAREIPITIRGEQWLWCAVIHQALIDLDDECERDQAKRWLLHDKKDFVTICCLAGIAPHLVRRAAFKKCYSSL